MALQHDPGPVNLGNPRESTIRELAELVLALTAGKSRSCKEPLPVDDPTRRCPDITKAKALLDWEPKIPLEEGLRKTIEYMRDVVVERQRATPGRFVRQTSTPWHAEISRVSKCTSRIPALRVLNRWFFDKIQVDEHMGSAGARAVRPRHRRVHPAQPEPARLSRARST